MALMVKKKLAIKEHLLVIVKWMWLLQNNNTNTNSLKQPTTINLRYDPSNLPTMSLDFCYYSAYAKSLNMVLVPLPNFQ